MKIIILLLFLSFIQNTKSIKYYHNYYYSNILIIDHFSNYDTSKNYITDMNHDRNKNNVKKLNIILNSLSHNIRNINPKKINKNYSNNTKIIIINNNKNIDNGTYPILSFKNQDHKIYKINKKKYKNIIYFIIISENIILKTLMKYLFNK